MNKINKILMYLAYNNMLMSTKTKKLIELYSNTYTGLSFIYQGFMEFLILVLENKNIFFELVSNITTMLSFINKKQEQIHF